MRVDRWCMYSVQHWVYRHVPGVVAIVNDACHLQLSMIWVQALCADAVVCAEQWQGTSVHVLIYEPRKSRMCSYSNERPRCTKLQLLYVLGTCTQNYARHSCYDSVTPLMPAADYARLQQGA